MTARGLKRQVPLSRRHAFKTTTKKKSVLPRDKKSLQHFKKSISSLNPPTMSFPYKTVLVLGATSGIGLALAEKMIENGCHVIAVGRRKEHLDSFVSKHGKEKASSFTFDITDLSSIPSFAESFVPSPSSLLTKPQTNKAYQSYQTASRS